MAALKRGFALTALNWEWVAEIRVSHKMSLLLISAHKIWGFTPRWGTCFYVHSSIPTWIRKITLGWIFENLTLRKCWSCKNPWLGGGFKGFYFHPEFWENDPNWLEHIFQMGDDQPPTRNDVFRFKLLNLTQLGGKSQAMQLLLPLERKCLQSSPVTLGRTLKHQDRKNGGFFNQLKELQIPVDLWFGADCWGDHASSSY